MRGVALASVLLAFGGAASASEITATDGESPPAVRPCIDIVARGSLEPVGDPVSIPDDSRAVPRAVYASRFTKREVLLGELSDQTLNLSRIEELRALRLQADDVVVLLGERGQGTRFSEWLPVWQDDSGSAFVPIFHSDDVAAPIRSRDWRPAALERFAKPVMAKADGVQDDGGPRLVARLYLDDIPAMMAAARDEDCWR